MQQRLLELGKWLKTNGEAIYGSRAFITSKKREAINSETNKTIYFTQKNKDVFMICLDWPKGDIILKDLKPAGIVKVQLLGSDKPVSTKVSEGSIIIGPPVLTPDDYQTAYVFKVSGLNN
jgi:alpha-L-fucosidase